MRRVRRKIRWSRVILLLFFVVILAGSVAGTALYAFQAISATTEKIRTASGETGRINILLLGLDDGDENYPESPRRSDAMILASINTDDGTINLLSIPRDTMVHIPGHKGYDKITHAHFYGGPQLSSRTVAEFLELPIHYYAAVDWQGFIKFVNIVGGVNMYVERDMNYEDPYANLKIHLVKGYQRLDGQKAGEYIRFRSDELGDIGRVQRQQKFIKALSAEILSAGSILKMPELINAGKENIQTDIPPMVMLKLVYSLKGLNTSSIHIEMLPGNFATVGGVSYWKPDKEQISQLMDKHFHSHTAAISSVLDKNNRSN